MSEGAKIILGCAAFGGLMAALLYVFWLMIRQIHESANALDAAILAAIEGKK